MTSNTSLHVCAAVGWWSVRPAVLGARVALLCDRLTIYRRFYGLYHLKLGGLREPTADSEAATKTYAADRSEIASLDAWLHSTAVGKSTKGWAYCATVHSPRHHFLRCFQPIAVVGGCLTLDADKMPSACSRFG